MLFLFISAALSGSIDEPVTPPVPVPDPVYSGGGDDLSPVRNLWAGDEQDIEDFIMIFQTFRSVNRG